MQERTFYEDQDLRITAADIRCKRLTIRTDSITSVSLASARPMKWAPLYIVFLLLPLGFCAFLISRLFGARVWVMLIPFLVGFMPLAGLFVLSSFIRVSRIYLQTSGGPVELAFKIQLSDPAATLARFESIKGAIEQAMKAPRSS